MLQNGQTELRKVCFQTFRNLPEGVYRLKKSATSNRPIFT